jgi:S-adenosylmethionine synthetase
MIRVSEMVLPGHPDKVCDIIADAIVAEAYRVDPHAYAQVEVGIWCDSIWLSGSVAAAVVIEKQIDEIVRDTLCDIGLRGGNTIPAQDFAITCNVGVTCEDPMIRR